MLTAEFNLYLLYRFYYGYDTEGRVPHNGADDRTNMLKPHKQAVPIKQVSSTCISNYVGFLYNLIAWKF